MEQRLGVLFIFTGLVPLALSASREFTLVKEGLTWSEAQAYCRAHHTDLANIESAADTAKIQNLFLTHNLASSALIGLYNDMKSWKWSMDDSPLGSFAIWDPSFSEPNNYKGNQLCVAVFSDGLFDSNCGNLFPFMCFDGTKTGISRYVLITTNNSWTEAQSYCRANYDDLVTIRDSAEHSSIVSLTNGYTWTSLHREGWKWTDVTNKFPINWDSKQPDNYNWDENCGTVLNGLAADESCTLIKPFICYTYQSSIQMIQLKVQSSLDVNDSAVMAAILEQIKQKLIMLGLPETINVTWKKHQDGAVFKKLGIKHHLSSDVFICPTYFEILF